MKDKTCIVTGGAGFIGSNLVDELVNQGAAVIVIDNESADAHEQFYYNEHAVYHKDDVCKYGVVLDHFKYYKPDYVFHLAAEARIQPTIENPLLACHVNFIGTGNILQASRLTDVKRVMMSSTSSAYGLSNEPPLTETMQRDCLTPYSVTKTAAEDLCKVYYTLYGLETIIFRYFNVYGNRQPIKGQYAPVIGLFMKAVQQGDPMTVVGSGLQTRDFCNVLDVVRANILAATALKGLGEVHNIGTGKSYSVLDIANMIGDDIVHVPARLGEATDTLANIEKARNNLNWKPEIGMEDWLHAHK